MKAKKEQKATKPAGSKPKQKKAMKAVTAETTQQRTIKQLVIESITGQQPDLQRRDDRRGQG